MKKLFLLIIFTLGVVLAKPVVGNAYVISALGIKNTPNSVDYVSGDTSVSGNANYVLSPQVIIYQEGLSYVGSYTPFTGCLNSQHYTNGAPDGMCITGIVNDLTTGGTDKALSAEQGKILNDRIRVNLLNPTAQTKTINGVTFTNNGDGTYTLNGTSTDNCYFFLTDLGFTDMSSFGIEKGKSYKLVGCPHAGDYIFGYHLRLDANPGGNIIDVGNGIVFTLNEDSITYQPAIYVGPGVTCDNLVFKPMLTTDLNATYDDFVSFDNSLVTGSTVSQFTESYEIRKNAAYHNSIVRGKDITSYYKDGSL